MASSRSWRVRDLMHPPLLPEVPNGVLDLAMGELLHGFLQGRILLADDFVQVRRVHPGFLELLKRPAGFHALVLARVTQEDHPVLLLQAVQKVVDLARARQARLIHNVKMPPSAVRVGPGEMVL